MIQLDLVVRFRSDWAVGSGHAQHDAADSLIRRDQDLLPMVPGKTLRGILRDTTESIALGLDDGAPSGTWDSWTRRLWGSGQSDDHAGGAGIVDVPSAVVDDAARAALTADERLVTASTITRTSVAIDSANGTARHNMLRTLERGRRGWELRGSLDIGLDAATWQAPTMWPARFLLTAALHSAGRLGSDRRRGAGAVALQVPDLDAEWDALLTLANDTESDEVPRAPSPTGRRRTKRTSLSPWGGGAITPGWQRFVVTLRTLDPVLVRSQVLGNAALSHPFIPGAVLLPLVAQALQDSSRAIVSDQLIVTDATPGQNGADRSLAMPLCLHRPKVPATHEDDMAINVMLGDLRSAQGTLRQTVGLGDFLGPDAGETDGSPVRLRTKMVTTVHNSIEDDLQRPGLNSLYSYEAIAPGSLLTFEVLLQDAARLDPSTLLPPVARVGGAQSAEYGRVKLDCVPAPALSHAFAGSGGITGNTSFTIWLVSALLPERGDDLAALLDSLGHALGTTLELAPDSSTPSLMARSTRRDSWQARWNLPRPSLAAFEAGTVLRVTANSEVTAAQIADTEAGGVGLRRAEGFGRVLIRPPLLDNRSLTVPLYRPPDRARPAAGEPTPDWLLATNVSACLAAAEDGCWLLAERSPLDSGLSRSQVGRLRSAAEQALASSSLTPLQAWATTVNASQQKAAWGGRATVTGLTDPHQTLQQLDPDSSRLAPLLKSLPEREREAVLLRATCMLVLARAQSYTVRQSHSAPRGDQ